MLNNLLKVWVRVGSATTSNLEVRTRVRAHLNLDVRGACVRPQKLFALICVP